MSILPEVNDYKGKGVAGIDITDFVNKLRQIMPNIETSELFPKAIRKGAEVFVAPLEAATPIRWANLTRSGAPLKKYKTKYHVKAYRPPGSARRSVIVYKRNRGTSYYQSDVNATTSYLVGYEKKMAYYMYWNEYGNKHQPARPVIRPVFDVLNQDAIEAALAYIKKEMGE
jgi:HK97 gp10 family phage protein